jgi:centromeric protein E
MASNSQSTSTGDARATITKLPRTVPFTPKRASAVLESRLTTPSAIPPTKKYKAALSTESRTRTTMKLKPPASSVPGTPSVGRPKTPMGTARPKTPTTPRMGTDSPIFDLPSENDVSRVDPEENIVDYQSVEVGDISVDLDESIFPNLDYGAKDKVLVSVR